MIFRNNSNLKLKIMNLIIALISIYFSLIGLNINPNGRFLIYIPIIFLILNLILFPLKTKYSYGFLTLNFIWVIRYAILPTLTIYNFIDIYSIEVYDKAIYILIIEMFISFVTLFIFDKKHKFIERDLHTENNSIGSFSKTKITILFIFLLLLIGSDLQSLRNYYFIFSGSIQENDALASGFVTLVISWSKYIIVLYLLDKVHRSKKGKDSLFFYSVFIVLISLSFHTGGGRNSLIIDGLSYLAILTFLYPHRKKTLSLSILAVVAFSASMITLLRFFDTNSLQDVGLFNFIASMTESLDAYFSGPNNVATGVRMNSLFSDIYSYKTLGKDIFANSIVFNKIFTNVPGTVYYFNLTHYNHSYWADQISPTITQSLALFGGFGFAIPSLITYLVLKFDIKSVETSDIALKFLYVFFSVKLAFYSHGNLTIIFTFVINNFLPLMIIVLFLKKKTRRRLNERN